MVVFSCSLSVVAGLLFFAGNQPFVRLWTGPGMGWPRINDGLLAVWLVISVLVHAHFGLVGQTKDFRFMRYLYLVEGTFFVFISALVVSRGGITAMLSVSIISSLLFSFPYGLWRISQYFNCSWRNVMIDWLMPCLRLGLILLPCAVIVSWLATSLSPLWQLVLGGGIIGLTGGVMLLRYGLDESLAAELNERLPRWLHRLVL